MRLVLRATLADAFHRTSPASCEDLVGLKFEMPGQPRLDPLYQYYAIKPETLGFLELAANALGVDLPTELDVEKIAERFRDRVNAAVEVEVKYRTLGGREWLQIIRMVPDRGSVS